MSGYSVVGFSLPNDLADQLRESSRILGVPVSALVTELVRNPSLEVYELARASGKVAPLKTTRSENAVRLVLADLIHDNGGSLAR
jgi:hypothetical protein